MRVVKDVADGDNSLTACAVAKKGWTALEHLIVSAGWVENRISSTASRQDHLRRRARMRAQEKVVYENETADEALNFCSLERVLEAISDTLVLWSAVRMAHDYHIFSNSLRGKS